MVESTLQGSKEDQIFLVVGDAGAGKSSFINCLLGQKVAFVLEENPGGHSVTQGANVYRSTAPKFIIIDTQGTNDTSNSNNGQILLSVMHMFLKDNTFISRINGVIYLHDSNIYSRCYLNLRTKELSKITGNQFQVAVICTKYNELKPATQKKLDVNILSQFRLEHQQHVLWDSVDYIENQRDALLAIISKFKPQQLAIVQQIEQIQVRIAKELQADDLVTQIEVQFDQKQERGTQEHIQTEGVSGTRVSAWVTWGEVPTIFENSVYGVFPTFPIDSYDRRITSIEVMCVKQFQVRSFTHTSSGIGSTKGCVATSMGFPSCQADNSSTSFIIDFVYSFKMSKKTELKVPRNSSHLPYMDIARIQAVAELFNKMKNNPSFDSLK